MDTHDQQRRILLRRTFFTGCALGMPALFVGCNRSDSGEGNEENTSGGGNNTGIENSKMSKADANYQKQPNGDQQCSKCEHFIAQSTTCDRVEGKVSPDGWCKFWTKKI